MRRLAVFVLSIIVAWTLLLAGTGKAQGARVLIVPASSVVAVGGTITTEIQVHDVVNLYGVDIRLTFDAARLEVLDADGNSANGVQIEPGNFLDPAQGFLAQNIADNTTGQMRYVFVLRAPAPAVSGSGVLARITFRARSPGSSALDFAGVALANHFAQPIPAALAGGLVVVSGNTATPSPTPNATATSTCTPTGIPSLTHTASATNTRTGTPSPMRTATNTRTPTGTPSPTRTATITSTRTATAVPSPTPTLWAVEEAVLEDAARTLGWPPLVVQQYPLYRIQYVAAAGHFTKAWMQRFDRIEDAYAALMQQRNELVTGGWNVEACLFRSYDAYRGDRSLNPGSPTLPLHERTFAFQASLWIVGAYAFDDTPYDIAPDPEVVVEAVYQAGRRHGLFANGMPRLFLPLMLQGYPLPIPTPTPIASATPSPTPYSMLQLIVNSSFETDEAWEILETAYPAGYSVSRAHSGTRSIRLGIDTGYNVYSFSSVQQAVTIPAGATQAQLSFYYFPVGPQADGDRIYFYVLRAGDNAVLKSTFWTERNQAWNLGVFNLLDYAGQHILLRFGAKNDGLGNALAVYLDDVELRVAGSE